MYDIGSRFRSFEVECALVCETNNKSANLPFSDKNWTGTENEILRPLEADFGKSQNCKVLGNRKS